MKHTPENIYNLSQLERCAADLARQLRTGTTFALYGSLGSGKTTFVKAFAKTLGVSYVTSPTFTLINVYPISHPYLARLCHADAYRVKDDTAFRDIGLLDYLSDPKTVCCIEWADRIKNILPKKRVDVWFSSVDEHYRHVRIAKRSEKGFEK